MTVAFEAGYGLPSGDLPLTHARVMHNGTQFSPSTIVASAEIADYPASAANIGDTVDRWRPFANEVASPSDFSKDDWTPTGITVGGDGKTLNEGTSTGQHKVVQPFTFSAGEYMVTAVVERQSRPRLVVLLNDGTTNRFTTFDLDTMTRTNVGGALSVINSLGNGRYELKIRVTALAGTGSVSFWMDDGGSTYTGTNKTVKLERFAVNPAVATLDFSLFTPQEADTFCVAAHNLGIAAGRISFQHDSNDDGTWTNLGTVDPTDNSPIMFIFEPVTSAKWRIQVEWAALPEVGVLRIGKALQMQQPFYAGFTPARMSRQVQVVGNISQSGELVGRTIKRSVLSAAYQWEHLRYDWVRANLDGPTGLMQSVEVDPLFVAWRPSSEQDVDYVMRAKVQPPAAMGMIDFWTFGLSGEAYSYE